MKKEGPTVLLYSPSSSRYSDYPPMSIHLEVMTSKYAIRRFRFPRFRRRLRRRRSDSCSSCHSSNWRNGSLSNSWPSNPPLSYHGPKQGNALLTKLAFTAEQTMFAFLVRGHLRPPCQRTDLGSPIFYRRPPIFVYPIL